MTTDQVSRRAMLGAIATLPAIGIAGQAFASTIDRSAWDRAMTNWARLKEIADKTGAACDHAWESVEDEAPQPDAFAHHFTQTESHRVLLYTADLDQRLATYERLAPVTVFPAAAAERSVREARQIVERIKAFRECRRIANERHDTERLAEVCDAAQSAFSDAESALIEMPAPDTTALLWKLERLWGEEADSGDNGGSYCNDWIAAVMADARRLLDRRA